MLRPWLFTLLLVVVARPVWSSTEAMLLGRSNTGSTALFNLGNHDNIRLGDYAIIVKPIRNLETKDLRLVPAAKARNVKVNSDSSVWILYRIYDQELLVDGDLYYVLSETSMLNGRIDPRMNRTTVVSEKGKTSEQTIYALGSDDARLAKLQKKYELVAPLHDREYKADGDFELLDLEAWEKAGQVRYRSALYKSPHQKEFRRGMRLATFEKMVTSYLRHVNNPNFNYEDFYEDQMKSTFANELRVKTNFNTEYEDFIFKQSQKNAADAKVYRSLLEKGDRWSEDFSDEELEKTLKQVSVLQEKDRRYAAINKPKRWGVFIDYGLGLNDTQTKDDPGHRRDSLNYLDFGVEMAPFLKRESYGKFTLEGGLRFNKSAFDANSFNADIDERSLSLGANWYPFKFPNSYDSTVFFLGLYVRSGFALVAAPTANEEARYTVMAVPGFKLGLRYNFKNNLSLRIVGSVETLILEQIESNRQSTLLPEREDLVEGKTGFGIGYCF